MYNSFVALSTFIHPWIDTLLCGLFDQPYKIESIKSNQFWYIHSCLSCDSRPYFCIKVNVEWNVIFSLGSYYASFTWSYTNPFQIL